jgi:hypothetical protein
MEGVIMANEMTAKVNERMVSDDELDAVSSGTVVEMGNHTTGSPYTGNGLVDAFLTGFYH